MDKETSSLPEFVRIKKIITENKRVKSFYFEKKLASVPGQFIMVWVPGVGERPFSLFEDKKGFMISVAKVGKVTEAIHQLKVGDQVGIRGPYGSYFTLPPKKGELVMVAGGYGIVPLAYLAAVAKAEGYKVTVLKGSRTSEDELYQNLLSRHKIKSFAATDDGTLGRKGFVHELFWDYLQNRKAEMIYICGPEMMEYQMAKLCWKHDVPFQVSVERYIKCGIGLCGSCVVDDTGWRICQEGPVFSGEKLKLIKEFGKYRRSPSGIIEKYAEYYKFTFADKNIESKEDQKKKLEQILKEAKLRTVEIPIYGSDKRFLTIVDLSRLEGEQRIAGNYFVSFPQNIADVLPGTIIAADDFVKMLKPGQSFIRTNLLFNGQKTKGDLFSVKSKGFSLYVSHPSINPYAIWISEIAARLNAFANQHNRAEYQGHLFHLFGSILKKNSDYDLRIVEDCLASGDTIVGVLTLLLEKQIVKLPNRKVRIDVIVASTPALLVLWEFAKQNQLELELNIGYLAYGLSEGQKVGKSGARIHANYVIYAETIFRKRAQVFEKLENYRAYDGNIYVVGNMGDAAQSMEERFDALCPWNKYRDDAHGGRRARKEKEKKFDPKKRTCVFIAKGGYLMKAFFEEINPKSTDNKMILSASAIWSKEKKYGLGVLVTL